MAHMAFDIAGAPTPGSACVPETELSQRTPSKPKQRIGFVGVGQMGLPMAMRLLAQAREEIELSVFDVQAERAALLTPYGARVVARVADVAQPGGIVVSMVHDGDALLDIALGNEGILAHLDQGGVHVSLSTIDPGISTRLMDRYARQGSTYLAGSVLGRPDVAEAGKLSIFLSGEASAKARVIPWLALLGEKVHDVDAQIEAANVYKLAYNSLIACAQEAMGEAARLIDAYGLDRAAFFRMLTESVLFGGTVYETYGRMIGERDFSDARFPTWHGMKDLNLALEVGRRKKVDLSCTAIARKHLLAAQAAGRAAEDWSVLSDFAGFFPTC